MTGVGYNYESAAPDRPKEYRPGPRPRDRSLREFSDEDDEAEREVVQFYSCAECGTDIKGSPDGPEGPLVCPFCDAPELRKSSRYERDVET